MDKENVLTLLCASSLFTVGSYFIYKALTDEEKEV